LINMLVAVDLMPVTGQPLPLVSMGGTSIWFTCISIGIILSVSRYIEEHADEETGSDTTKNYANV
jgi:cell division protein FtsW